MKTKKKFTSRLFAAILALVMVCGMMPMTAFAEDSRTPVSTFVGTSNISAPANGQSIYNPTFNLTQGTQAVINTDYMGNWKVYNEAKKSYETAFSSTFFPGKWRYEVRLQIDSKGGYGATHVIASSATVTINGTAWDHGEVIVGPDASSMWIASPEYVITGSGVTTISSVDIEIAEPHEYDSPAGYAIVKTPGCAVKSIDWYEKSGSVWKPLSGKFMAGKKYSISVDVEPVNSNFKFSASGLTATLNGNASVTKYISDSFVYVDYDFGELVGRTPVSKFAAKSNIGPITNGQAIYTPTFQMTDGMAARLFEDDDGGWMVYNNSTGKYEDSTSGTFTPGKWIYFCTLSIDEESGWGSTHVIANPVSVTVNGEKWTVHSSYIEKGRNFSNVGVYSPEFVIAEPVKPAITMTSLPDGDVGVPYSCTLKATGDTPVAWSVDSGTLPDGLRLNRVTGAISGTPTAIGAGSSTFTIKASNAAGDDTRSLTITVNEATITSVNIGITEPMEGSNPVSTGTFPENTTVSLNWYPVEKGVTGPALTGTDEFAAGKIYRCAATILPNTGYKFTTSANVTFNTSKTANITTAATDRIVCYYDFTAPAVINAVNVDVTEPVGGAKPAVPVLSTPNTTLSSYEWFRVNKESGKIILPALDLATYEFIAGGTYRCVVIVKPATGYGLSGSPVATFNTSQTAHINSKSATSINFRYDFTPSEPTISLVNIDVTEPIVGANPAMSAVSADGTTVSELKWYPVENGVTGPALNGYDKFAAGKTYRCSVSVIPKPGHDFAASAGVTFNTSNAAVIVTNSVDRIECFYDFKMPDVINAVNINVAEPVGGAKPAVPVLSTPNTTLSSYEWFRVNKESGKIILPALDLATYEFIAGETYRCVVIVKPGAEYYFSETPVTTFNTSQTAHINSKSATSINFRYDFTVSDTPVAKTLSKIEIVTPPNKTTYTEGETFDRTGMLVQATYTDGSIENVTLYNVNPSGALSTSDTSVTVVYYYNGDEKTATQAITVNPSTPSGAATCNITKGNGQTFTKGSGKTLEFTCDGDFGKFSELLIDGKTVDASNYDKKSGSTIVTLKSAYLDTLAEGNHDIQFVYQDGKSNVGTFTVAKAQGGNTGGNTGGNNAGTGQTTSPQTGDNSNLALWLALMCLGGIGVAGTVIYGKRRKYQR